MNRLVYEDYEQTIELCTLTIILPFVILIL